jgi:glycosyltransferase involved in cell wall biosynthesis
MQRKRIIIVGPAHPLRGGLAAFNERYARALQQAGHEVIIYTYSLQYPSVLFPGKSQYTADPAPADLDIRVKINSINPLNWISTAKEISKLSPDIVMFRFWIPFMGPALGTIARTIRKHCKAKIIGFLDNVIPHEKRIGDKGLTSWFLNSCDGFIVMSQQVAGELKQFVPEAEYAFMHHPIYDYGTPIDRATAFAHLKLDADKKLLLFFGFIREYKGLDLLLRALQPAIKEIPDLHLVVAGEFYEPEEPYTAMVEKHGLNDYVTFHKNYIPDAEVKYYFGAADLVVQPYKSATQSGISQLAYHFEKPMIVTNVGGLPEIVPNGEAGYVTTPEPDAIASAIIRYFKENKLESFTEGVRKHKSRFSWEHFVAGTEELIGRL